MVGEVRMNRQEWKTIPGYEGRYEISSDGLVRSIARTVPMITRNRTAGIRRIKSHVLAMHSWGAKYPGVVLVADDGLRTRRMVHQLVAEGFVQNPLGYVQINHIDADTWNCRASNLEWCDQSINVAHSYAIGNRPTGKNHHFAQLPRDSEGRCFSDKPKKDGGGWAKEEF